MPELRARRHTLGLILIGALVLRLVAIAAVGDREFEHEFEALTKHLLEGYGFAYYTESTDGNLVEGYIEDPVRVYPSAYMPPAYPFLLWVVTALLGTGPLGVVTVELLQAILGVVSCWLLYLIVRDRFRSETTALLAAAGFAGYPLLAYMPAQISAVNLSTLLLLVSLWALFRAERRNEAGTFVLAGFAFGLTVLARSQFIVFIPAALVWLAWVRAPRLLRHGALFAGCALLVLVPWTLRNAAVLGVATPLATSGGATFGRHMDRSRLGRTRPTPSRLGNDL